MPESQTRRKIVKMNLSDLRVHYFFKSREISRFYLQSATGSSLRESKVFTRDPYYTASFEVYD